MTDKVKLYAVKNDEGEWLSLDDAKMGIWYSNNPTLFKNKIYAEAQRMGRKAHVVTLVEEQKVKLPREVGEELDEYKRGFEHDINVLDLLVDVDNLSELLKTNKWLYDSDGYRSEHANRLIDAYRYGWEAEPEELFYVKAPENWVGDGLSHFIYMCKSYTDVGIDRTNAYKNNPYAKFTRAELKLYHLDSDIFTLVPVEEEK